jgi:hypothetical protein
MAIIPQISLFSWKDDIENLGDNKRLKSVLEHLPDEELVSKLEKERGHGRDDYPVRPMWNLLIAMFVFGHSRQADILRELRRNVQLRFLCGFNFGKLPGEDNFSRFIKKLMEHKEEMNSVFISLADKLYDILPDFGKTLAIDSKWTWSLANKTSDRKYPDGRSEADAEWGIKEYRGVDKDGKAWSSKKKCFGFKTHLIVDTKYELPVAFIVTPANASDVICGKELLEQIAEDRPHVIERCRHITADKAYDDNDLIEWLQDAKRGIKPVIDKRTMWKVEEEKEIPGHPQRYYDEHGNVFCYADGSGERHRMIPIGYDKERNSQRFRCPVTHYGVECSGTCECTLAKTIRISLKTDRRIFTEVGRTQYIWKRIYAGRTAVERVNSRLDVSFGFEARRIRGKKKMELFAALTFAVMDALAVWRIEQDKPDLMRSLVTAA